MNCSEYQALIDSYLGDELEEELRTEVESHLVGCPDCGHKVSHLQSSLSRLQETFPELTPPAELWEKIQARMKAQ